CARGDYNFWSGYPTFDFW
nr:immunoglobulin heavy chain junction region [Macaca mulatta]